MNIIFAHAGEDHATKTSSFSHFVKNDGLIVVAIAAVTALVLYGALRLFARKSSIHKQNDD